MQVVFTERDILMFGYQWGKHTDLFFQESIERRFGPCSAFYVHSFSFASRTLAIEFEPVNDYALFHLLRGTA